MARARNIKPGFFKNEILAELPPFDRLLFVGLWCLADREGRLEDRPKRIKIELFPCDECDVESGLYALATSGFISRYVAAGEAVIEIVNFRKHQAPHGTEKDSALPDERGRITVHERGKNGYATGKTSFLTVKPQEQNSERTGQEHPDSLIHRFTDSPIPDSKEKPARDKPARRLVVEKPDGVDSQVWADFVAQRNVKRAPITQTALNGIKKQAAIAGIPIEDALSMICERGWTGFKADWVATGGQHAKSDRTGKPSLAERVSAGARAAIASIDARETACRAVGEDGAHLRASLDGDFRGDGRG